MKIDKFSTDYEKQTEKTYYWNRINRLLVGTCKISPVKSAMKGNIERRSYGVLQVFNIEASPAVLESLGDTRFSGIFILKNLKGSCELGMGKQRYSLSEGCFSIIEASSAYWISATAKHHFQALYLPNESIVEQLSDYLETELRSTDYPLVSAFIEKLATADASKISSHNMLKTALDIIEIEWPRSNNLTLKNNGIGRLESIENFVNVHLSDPNLSIAMVAESLHISSRYIQQLYAEQGLTLSKSICEKRLVLAKDYLATSARSITDIASNCGFSDISYFCRCFKNRFGITARQFRLNAHA